MKIRDLPFKVTALLEIVGVFVVGGFLASQIETWRGRSLGTVLESALKTTPPDWVAASVGWLEVMSIRHACFLLPAFALGWWRREAGPKYYGLTTSGHPVSRLLAIGVVAFALVGLVVLLLNLSRQVFSLGPHPGLLSTFLTQPWPAEFWLFLAVASFGFQPLMEEVFFRGYMQTRLEEAYGGVGAIVIVSMLAALGHNQYHHLTLMSVGAILLVLLLNVAVGYLYWKYRSLFPAVLVHGLVNIPAKGVFEWIELGVLLAVLVFFRREWVAGARELFGAMRVPGWKRACLGAGALATIASIGFASSPRATTLLAGIGLVVALAIEGWLKRSPDFRAPRTV